MSNGREKDSQETDAALSGRGDRGDGTRGEEKENRQKEKDPRNRRKSQRRTPTAEEKAEVREQVLKGWVLPVITALLGVVTTLLYFGFNDLKHDAMAVQNNTITSAKFEEYVRGRNQEIVKIHEKINDIKAEIQRENDLHRESITRELDKVTEALYQLQAQQNVQAIR